MGTYDEPRFEKTNIFAHVNIGQPVWSEKINGIYFSVRPSVCYVCDLQFYVFFIISKMDNERRAVINFQQWRFTVKF